MALTLHPPIDRTFDEIEAATRREFIVGGASLALLLAACGGGGSDDSSGGDDTEATRSVDSSDGTVEVPAEPRRVAALVGSADIDVMLLGIEPVFSGTFAEGWVELPEGIATSDTTPPPIEVVANARPDLLIGWDWLAEEPGFDELSDIAPMVTLPSDDDWRRHFALVADAVNRASEGEEALAAFDERCEALRARITEAGPFRVALVGTFEPGAFWWWEASYPACAHLASVGFEIVGPDATLEGVSAERITEVDADWIIFTGTPGTDDGTDDLFANPLWATLPAVQADQVQVVDRALWGGAGLMWANALLDDIERLFL